MLFVFYSGRFSMERARSASGWLAALNHGHELTPETAEYGISSFVYKARAPFHPGRLHAFFEKYFVLQEPDWSEAMADEAGDDEHDQAHPHAPAAAAGNRGGAASMSGGVPAAAQQLQRAASALADAAGSLAAATGGAGGNGRAQGRQQAAGNDAALAAAVNAAAAAASAAAAAAAAAASVAGASASGPVSSSQPAPASTRPTTRAALTPSGTNNPASSLPMPSEVDPLGVRRAARMSTFGNLLRSKGFVWVAGRDDHCAEWSSAGGLVRFGTGGPWFCVLPRWVCMH
jgi:hypothetical protein